jgi:pimeloyl-ACP methyl ester carboxylesterase
MYGGFRLSDDCVIAAGALANRQTYVLVHGAFFGGWCWKFVAAALRERGHRVFTPTLTGVGERAHLMAARPTLGTYIEDVAQVVRFEGLSDVILVGHSLAGSVVSGLADRMPQALRHLVYVDAQLLLSGQSPASRAVPARMERYRSIALETEHGLMIPAVTPGALGVSDPEMAAWVAARMTPQSLSVYYDTLELNHPLGNGVPATYIACTAPPLDNVANSHELARQTAGWTYQQLPTGHSAMLTMPDELAARLDGIGNA